MKPKGDIFQLIKSLSRSERRYFRLFASQHIIGKQNNYLKLFDAIDAQEDFDQKALLQLPFVKNLSSEKNYLFHLLLKSMRAFYSKARPEQEIFHELENFYFLEKRGLYPAASRSLKRARKKAYHFEKLQFIPQILEEEATIVKRENGKDQHSEIMRILKEKAEAVQLIGNESRYAAIYHQVFVTSRRALDFGKPEFQNALTSFMEHDLRSPPPEHATVQAKLYYHQALYMIHQSRKEPREAHPHFAKIVELMEESPHLIENFDRRYRVSLSNLLVSAFTNQLWDVFPEILAKLRNGASEAFDVEAEVFQNVCYLEMVYHLNLAQFEQAMQLVPEIKEGLTQYQSYMNKARELAIVYNLVLLYFFCCEMSNARKWLNLILNQTDVQHRKDIQNAARLLELVILFEEEEVDLLEYKMRAYARSSAASNGERELSNLLMDYFKRVLRAKGKEALREQDLYLKGRLDQRSKEARLEYDCTREVLYWVKSRLLDRSMVDLIKDEVKDNWP